MAAGLEEKLKGPLVGITMMASAAEQVGLGGHVVTAAEALRGCGTVLGHAEADDALDDPWWAAYFFDLDSKGANPYGMDQHTFNLVSVLAVARLKALLEAALDPAALLFFARARVLPGSSAGGVAPAANIEWPLGALLSYPWA